MLEMTSIKRSKKKKNIYLSKSALGRGQVEKIEQHDMLQVITVWLFGVPSVQLPASVSAEQTQ